MTSQYYTRGFLSFMLFLILSLPSLAHADANYDFELDTIGQTPLNTTVTEGNFDVQNQAAKGITPAVGYFGPLTRAQMKTAQGENVWW